MNKDKQKRYRIEYIKPGCIGCRACAKLCPNFWEMEDDKTEPFPKAMLKNSEKIKNEKGIMLKEILETDDKETAIKYISICTVTVIKAFETKTNKPLEKL